MTIVSCLIAKAGAGIISKKDVSDLEGEVTRLMQDPAGNMSELQAAQKAHADGAFVLAQKELNITTNIKTQQVVSEGFDAALAQKKDAIGAVKSFFNNTQHTAYSKALPHTPLQTHIRQHTQKYTAELYDVLNLLKRGYVSGKYNKTSHKEVVTGLFELERTGKITSPISKEAVEAATKTFEVSRFGAKESKRLGGLINAEHDSILGVRSSPAKLRMLAAKVPDFEKKFVSHVAELGVDLPHLNRTLGTNIATKAELEEFLSMAYKTMLSGGLLDSNGRFIPLRMKRIGTADNLARALRLTDAKATYEFIETYGAGNMSDTLVEWASTRGIQDAGKTAFGPSPRAARAAILEKVKQTSPEMHQKAEALFDRYAAHQGLLHAADGYSDAYMSLVSTTAKAAARANLLGKTGTWQFLVDMWNLPNQANRFKGLPVMKNILANYREMFKSGALKDAERSMMSKRGLLLEGELQELSDTLLSAIDQGGMSKKVGYSIQTIDRTVQKLTGGTRSINATTEGSQKFLMNELSSLVEKGDLEAAGPELAGFLRSHGFDKDVLKFVKENAFDEFFFEEHAFLGIDVKKLNTMDSDEGRKAALAITSVLMDHQQAINPKMPTGVAAYLKQQRNAGKPQRILAEGGAFLGSYFSGYVKNMAEMMAEMPGNSQKMKLLGLFITSSVVAAYEMTMISDLLNGRDPAPLSTDLLAKILSRSMGPIGDALVSGGDAMGGDMVGSAFPGLNYMANIGSNAIQAVKHGAKGDFDKIPAPAVKLFSRLMPGMTAPVFGKLWESYINDQLLYAMDPEAARKFRAKTKRSETNRGSGSWWGPGETEPTRAPDFSKMLSLYVKPESQN